MCAEDEVLDTEFLIFRVPPDQLKVVMTKIGPDGVEHVTTCGVSPGKNNIEQKRSCSRASITAPMALKRMVNDDNWQEWRIARLRVSDARELGFGVEFDRNDEDPGHCNIELLGKDDLSNNARKRQWKKLGEKCPIIPPEEYDTAL